MRPIPAAGRWPQVLCALPVSDQRGPDRWRPDRGDRHAVRNACAGRRRARQGDGGRAEVGRRARGLPGGRLHRADAVRSGDGPQPGRAARRGTRGLRHRRPAADAGRRRPAGVHVRAPGTDARQGHRRAGHRARHRPLAPLWACSTRCHAARSPTFPATSASCWSPTASWKRAGRGGGGCAAGSRGRSGEFFPAKEVIGRELSRGTPAEGLRRVAAAAKDWTGHPCRTTWPSSCWSAYGTEASLRIPLVAQGPVGIGDLAQHRECFAQLPRSGVRRGVGSTPPRSWPPRPGRWG